MHTALSIQKRNLVLGTAITSVNWDKVQTVRISLMSFNTCPMSEFMQHRMIIGFSPTNGYALGGHAMCYVTDNNAGIINFDALGINRAPSTGLAALARTN